MIYGNKVGVRDSLLAQMETLYDLDLTADVFAPAELLDVLAAGETDEDQINRTAQMLDAYMQAQQDFLDQSGLME